MKAAQAGAESDRTNQLCYAHLYLGLYFEALGELEKAKEHMLKSAIDYKMDHYMGKTAQVHLLVRGWVPVPKRSSTVSVPNRAFLSQSCQRKGGKLVSKAFLPPDPKKTGGHP
jgi:hypothetical protein